VVRQFSDGGRIDIADNDRSTTIDKRDRDRKTNSGAGRSDDRAFTV
jgi:hypothetical protein